MVTLTCPDFLYQREFGKPFFILLVPSHPAGAARRESFSRTAARRLQGRDAVAAKRTLAVEHGCAMRSYRRAVRWDGVHPAGEF